ncbi:esterase-like activity of phytase family protein [Stappia sp. ES.058]|uniref:esterase-like activity of phytase family protein n=1 Tax=Stappia sp. ES.058 TaxID=1881061 RepID=UPI0012FE3254|nr:esterase-like activity of phytase family protein [Stappia sp. ES.058]
MPRRLAPLLLMLALAPALAGAALARKQIDVTAIDVQTKQIERFRIGAGDDMAAGRLTFLGGLELLSGTRHMGGLSGLVVTGDGGDLLAAADNGLWFQARIVSDTAGRPLAVEDARIAPMLGPDGRPLADSGRGDSEGVTLRRGAQGAEVLVSTERIPHVYAFPFPLSFEARGRDIVLPPGIRRLRHNKGMEAIAAANTGPLAGTLVIIGERGLTFADDLPGFLIGGANPGEFTVARQDAYDATDAAFLPDGDLLLLERRFTLRHGLGMRLRLFSPDELAPGRRAVGTVLLEAGYTDQIDNMEGLAVHESREGKTILTLISDDNRSILQRTLLLRFRLDQ